MLATFSVFFSFFLSVPARLFTAKPLCVCHRTTWVEQVASLGLRAYRACLRQCQRLLVSFSLSFFLSLPVCSLQSPCASATGRLWWSKSLAWDYARTVRVSNDARDFSFHLFIYFWNLLVA